MKKFATIASAGLVALAGLPLAAQQVDFKKDILPILEQRCIECHTEGNIKSELRMDTREFLLKGGTVGPSLVEGKSAESLMIHLVEGTRDDFERMPPKSDPLPDEQIALLKAWIDQGAVWPEDVQASKFGTQGRIQQLKGWLVEATAQEGPLAQWALVQDIKGPNGEQAIAVTHPNPAGATTSNLLWTPGAALKDGSIEVKIKATSGTDAGGGVVWRVQDKDNYYAARYSGASKTVILSKMVDGVETEISSAPFEASADAWVTLKAAQQGDQITVSADGKEVLTATDGTFADAGGVGYWTKADAASAFAGAKLDKQS